MSLSCYQKRNLCNLLKFHATYENLECTILLNIYFYTISTILDLRLSIDSVRTICTSCPSEENIFRQGQKFRSRQFNSFPINIVDGISIARGPTIIFTERLPAKFLLISHVEWR